MLYFAYGSNLYWPQMKERCPSARFIGVAKLKDHRLAFTRYSAKRKGGVADVLPEDSLDTWGVIYQIDDHEIDLLDMCEGFSPAREQESNAYIREERPVYLDGDEKQPFVVSIYTAVPQADGPFLPHADYKRLIVEGAKHWKFPPAYIAILEQIVADE